MTYRATRFTTVFGGILLTTLVYLVFFSSCATRQEPGRTFNPERPYQAPALDFGEYKSPQQRTNGQSPDVLVSVAISGGGFRASNFGLGVLRELEQVEFDGRRYNALREIDALSTVSGGGLAAGAYVATLLDHIQATGSTTGYSLAALIDQRPSQVLRNFERGYHNDLVFALLHPSTIGDLDRGDFLEKEFDQKILGAEYRDSKASITLGDVFQEHASGGEQTTPWWIANATIFENGGIFPFTPGSLRRYQITGYTHRLATHELKGDFFSLPLSVGVKASASFPAAIPATTLSSSYDTDNPYLHLFDGGLSDNLGVSTALQVLSQLPASRKVLIVIDAYNGQAEPFSKTSGSPVIGQIINRSTAISLDAWRLRHREELRALSTGTAFGPGGLRVIYLSFDDLPAKLRESVVSIGTNFEISKCEQRLLLEAARVTVAAQREQIVKAVFPLETKR